MGVDQGHKGVFLYDGLPPRSTIDPLMFYVYTAELPVAKSRKCVFMLLLFSRRSTVTFSNTIYNPVAKA